MFRLRKNSGFTLMELVVVIAIISVLCALAIPGYISWLPKHKLGNGARDILAQIDEEIIRNTLGNVQSDKAGCFEDQYLSTGGQIYELISGHDRFVADLRPLLSDILVERNAALGLCCHPYDICTELIAREAGVIITDEKGNPVKALLNITDNVTWVGYANEDIKKLVEQHLREALLKYHLI